MFTTAISEQTADLSLYTWYDGYRVDFSDISSEAGEPRTLVVEAQVHQHEDRKVEELCNIVYEDSVRNVPQLITEDLEKINVIQEGLSEADLISGIVETTEVANKVHVVATVGRLDFVTCFNR